MDLTPLGDSHALIVRLGIANDGMWTVYVAGGVTSAERRLEPVTLIIQLWHPIDASLLRGTIQLDGSDRCVVFQSNAELLELLQDWLPGDD